MSISPKKRASLYSKPYSELLTGRSHIQLMSPQCRSLPMQKQIRFAHSIRAHFLPLFLIFSILIHNSAIGDRMHYVNTLFAHLACEGLSQLSNTRSTGAVGCKLGTAAKSTECACENDGLRRMLAPRSKSFEVVSVRLSSPLLQTGVFRHGHQRNALATLVKK